MRSKRSFYLLPVVILPVLIVLQNPGLKESIHGITFSLLKPVMVSAHAVANSLIETRDHVFHFWQTFREYGQTQQKISEMESRLLQLEEVAKENERLRKLLDFRKTLPEKTIAARVIGWDTSAWRKTIILDKGNGQGIRKDMAVVASEGLVGRVIEVGPSTSRVILLTDPESRVSAIAGQSRAQGIVAGDGSSRLKMGYLELDGGAALEEMVLTSGMTGLFPKGIKIGKIVGMEKQLDGLHLAAEVEPYVRFSKLEEVLCLASSPQA